MNIPLLADILIAYTMTIIAQVPPHFLNIERLREIEERPGLTCTMGPGSKPSALTQRQHCLTKSLHLKHFFTCLFLDRQTESQCSWLPDDWQLTEVSLISSPFTFLSSPFSSHSPQLPANSILPSASKI